MDATSKYAVLLRKPCPHVAGALGAVVKLLRTMAASKSTQYCELEARLGRIVTDDRGKRRFVSGVEAAFAARLLVQLELSEAWTEICGWMEIVDRFYLLPSGLQVRTSCEATPPEDAMDASAADPAFITTHVIKTDIAHADFAWCDADGLLDNVVTPVYDVRISVKHEEPVFESELQERVDDMLVVRIKHRRSFRYTPAGHDRVMWSVDVTQVWQNTTYLDALAMLQNGEPPRYEVEVECLHPMDFIHATDYERVALSLLLKTVDLFMPQADLSTKPARLALVR